MLDDLRLAFRGLRRQPGFLVVALVTLGLAIGANVAVFSLVNATLLRPMPFGDRSSRVVSVHETHGSQAEDWEDARLSYPDLLDVRAANVLEQVEGFLSRNFTLGDGEAERVIGGSVTPDSSRSSEQRLPEGAHSGPRTLPRPDSNRLSS